MGSLGRLAARHGKDLVIWSALGVLFALILWFAYIYGAGAA